MPKLKGLKEREHRPFFDCPVCGKPIQMTCSLCRGSHCVEHHMKHSCLEVLQLRVENLYEQLDDVFEDTGVEIGLLEDVVCIHEAEIAMLAWETRIEHQEPWPSYRDPWARWSRKEREDEEAEYVFELQLFLDKERYA